MTSTMADPTTNTDRIEKKVVLRAPISRVWDAIADSRKFGEWFGVKLEQPFTAGTSQKVRMTKKGYEQYEFDMEIGRIEPQRYFSYRWHPYAIDPKHDYSSEPLTLVEFVLEEVKDGTALTITESGFDRLPASRRAEAFRMNDGGWTGQIKQIAAYVEK
ncbi:MAG TPA: SRPBCC family protein [Gemmatimonadaceae bacterium]|nr:SRPBCC family protein [Gemmatimonadaceae bacterium]